MPITFNAGGAYEPGAEGARQRLLDQWAAQGPRRRARGAAGVGGQEAQPAGLLELRGLLDLPAQEPRALPPAARRRLLLARYRIMSQIVARFLLCVVNVIYTIPLTAAGDMHSTKKVEAKVWFTYGGERSGRFQNLVNKVRRVNTLSKHACARAKLLFVHHSGRQREDGVRNPHRHRQQRPEYQGHRLVD